MGKTSMSTSRPKISMTVTWDQTICRREMLCVVKVSTFEYLRWGKPSELVAWNDRGGCIAPLPYRYCECQIYGHGFRDIRRAEANTWIRRSVSIPHEIEGWKHLLYMPKLFGKAVRHLQGHRTLYLGPGPSDVDNRPLIRGWPGKENLYPCNSRPKWTVIGMFLRREVSRLRNGRPWEPKTL